MSCLHSVPGHAARSGCFMRKWILPTDCSTNSQELFSEEALVAAGGRTQGVTDGDFPSSDSEDDDYNPEGAEKRTDSESEGESDEGGGDSDSGSDFRENEASGSDKDEQDPMQATNLERLARTAKRTSKEGSGGPESSGSDDSEVFLVDGFTDGGVKLGLRRRDSQAEESASDEETMVIAGKRHRKAVDYKRLHDVSVTDGHAHIILFPVDIIRFVL